MFTVAPGFIEQIGELAFAGSVVVQTWLNTLLFVTSKIQFVIKLFLFCFDTLSFHQWIEGVCDVMRSTLTFPTFLMKADDFAQKSLFDKLLAFNWTALQLSWWFTVHVATGVKTVEFCPLWLFFFLLEARPTWMCLACGDEVLDIRIMPWCLFVVFLMEGLQCK